MHTDKRQKSVLIANEVQHQAGAAQLLSSEHARVASSQSLNSVVECLWPLTRLCWAACLAFTLMLALIAFSYSWQHSWLYELFVQVFFSGAMISCYLLMSPGGQSIGALLALKRWRALSLIKFILGPGLIALLLAIFYCYWRFEPLAAQSSETISLASTIGLLLLLVAFGPLFEEILFRQLLLKTLIQKFKSVWSAALCSALAFAIMHSISTEQHLWLGIQLHQLLLFVAALLLSWIRLRYDSLWPAIILHVAYNLGVVLMSFYLAA
jgi:membrane protease YdiL (CAAX protease family)